MAGLGYLKGWQQSPGRAAKTTLTGDIWIAHVICGNAKVTWHLKTINVKKKSCRKVQLWLPAKADNLSKVVSGGEANTWLGVWKANDNTCCVFCDITKGSTHLMNGGSGRGSQGWTFLIFPGVRWQVGDMEYYIPGARWRSLFCVSRLTTDWLFLCALSRWFLDEGRRPSHLDR